jgi:hypothetical protein
VAEDNELLRLIIPAVSAALGAIVGAIARPWGQDYVDRKPDERADVQRKRIEDESQRAARLARLEGLRAELAENMTDIRLDSPMGVAAPKARPDADRAVINAASMVFQIGDPVLRASPRIQGRL